METIYPVYQGENGIGEAELVPEGMYVRVLCRCRKREDGLYRFYLSGAKGELLLGVAEPIGNAMECVCRVTLRQIEALGEAERVVLRRSFSFDTAEKQTFRAVLPPRLIERFPDLAGRTDILCAEETDGGYRIAVPFRPNAPLALTACFCLMRLETVQGTPYAVLTLDAEGEPIFPPALTENS